MGGSSVLCILLAFFISTDSKLLFAGKIAYTERLPSPTGGKYKGGPPLTGNKIKMTLPFVAPAHPRL